MKRRIWTRQGSWRFLISLLILLFIAGFATADTIHVPGGLPYIDIQQAINIAQPGDTIVIAPGTYIGTGYEINKGITITGQNPSNPAGTVIDFDGQDAWPAAFDLSGPRSTLSGITIANNQHGWAPVSDGINPGDDGFDGDETWIGRGGIRISGSHIVSNCIIRNCGLNSGPGGSGADGDPNGYPDADDPSIIPINDGGSGGRGGHAYGAGIYIDSGSPLILNTIVEDCVAIGGPGGGAGAGLDADTGDPPDQNLPGGPGGNGGNGGNAMGAGVYCDTGTSPTFINCIIRNNQVYAGDANDGGDGGDGIIEDVNSNFPGGDGGHGGVPGLVRGAGVYFTGTNATFTNCQFIGNRAYGANGGDGGDAGDVHLAMPDLDGGHGGLVEQSYPLPPGGTPQNGRPPSDFSAKGAGVYIESGSTATFTGCTFSDNATRGSVSGLGGFPNNGNRSHPRKNFPVPTYGAGVYCDDWTSTTFTDCTIQGNWTTQEPDQYPGDLYPFGSHPSPDFQYADVDYTGYGAGMCFVGAGSSSYVELNNCIIADNNAPVGGGVCASALIDFHVDECDFVNNSAFLGAGLFSIDNNSTISSSTFTGNRAYDPDGDLYGAGGGLYSFSSDVLISDCIISENTTSGLGAGLYMAGEVAIPPLTAEPVLKNCLLTNNEAGFDGGGIFCDWYTKPNIINCTITGNEAGKDPSFGVGYGGGLYCSYESDVNIINSIVWGNVSPDTIGHELAVETWFGFAPTTLTVSYCDIEGGQGEVWVDGGSTLNWGAGNIDEVPLFMNGYYLSQIAAGQSLDSPCVDAGSGDANDPNIGMDAYSTRTDDVNDTGIVDIGYHYFETITLELSVIIVGTHSGRIISPDPPIGIYPRGTVVELEVEPDNPTHRVRWTGTDDDSSTSLTNTVTMTAPIGVRTKEVWVEFYVPRTLDVPGDYTDIQSAVDDACDGDIIRIARGRYDVGESSQGFFEPYIHIYGKAVTIRSLYPDDPCYVAATVIENGGFYLWNVGRDTIINGLTIEHAQYWGDTIAEPGAGEPYMVPPPGPGNDGPPGISTYGGGMKLYGGASPTVRNCIFRDCAVYGVHGGAGNSGEDPIIPGTTGNGGPGGMAYGGAVYCDAFSSPLFENCLFIDCNAIGGDGGSGAAGSLPPNWHLPGHGGGWGDPTGYWWDYGPFLDFWKYSGYGGAVYCDSYSAPEFIDCNFVNNSAYGGSSGISGIWPNTNVVPGWPYEHYKIDRFGGAVYGAAGSSAKFTGCNFTDNQADVDGPATHREDDIVPVNADPYLSYGGAVAFEDGAQATFENCTFNGNLATIGGGMWAAHVEPNLSDCSFTANTAYHGGGVFFVGNGEAARIARSSFSGNVALHDTGIVEPDDPQEIYGEGGAVYCFDVNATIVDCYITHNDAGGSGGGIYIAGSDTALVKNCLITENFADRYGAGISADLHAEPNIVNCTIVNNRVTGGGSAAGSGGGLYISYDSFANIINSIIWDNSAFEGAQLAVGTGYPYGPGPSTVNVNYSDIGPLYDPCAAGLTALDVVFLIDSTGSMGGDIDAVKASAMEIVGLIADTVADYRIAVVDYKDFNQPSPDPNAAPYGGLTDYPYNDNLVFEDDTNAIVAAIDSLTASGGADWPESVYAALMHCIDHNSLMDTLGDNLYGAAPDSLGPGLWRTGAGVARIIILIGDAPPHDAEPFTGYTLDDIITAARELPAPKSIFSIPVRGDAEAVEYFTSLAEETGGVMLEAADASEVVDMVMTAIELIARVPSAIYVDVNCILNGWDWNPDTNNWEPNFADSNNISEDPNFVNGYYLSQIAAGQLLDSPCVDAGSADANDPNIGLDSYTTRTDSVSDANVVDMGYHYPLFGVPQYRLTFTVIDISGYPVPVIIEPGTYYPDGNSLNYNWYTTVALGIDPGYNSNYYQVLWTGTDDDELTGPDNTIIMDSHEVVTVQFVKNACDLTVGVIGSGGSVSPTGTYTYPRGTVVALTAYPDSGYRVKRWIGTDNDSSYATTNTVTMDGDKTVGVEFEPPGTITVPGDYTTIEQAIAAARNRDTIEIATGIYNTGTGGFVIDKEITLRSSNPDDPNVVAITIIHPVNRAFFFTSNAGPAAVLNGLTIAEGGFGALPADDGEDPGDNGGDGYGTEGGAMYFATGSAPTIRNCVITDFSLFGGDAGDGADANELLPGGRGGWAGWARGGGVYIAPDSSPTFINCTITNCTATGGDAGDGGDGAEGETDEIPWWQGPGYGGNWSDGVLWQAWGYIGDYRYYSAYGGGVYCAENSSPTFIACTISENQTQGGMSGIGGLTPEELITNPVLSYEIPSYGGGVYCAAGSTVEFIDCNIINNVSPKPGVDEADEVVYHLDPYLGHGGGIAFEETASVTFINCNIVGNEASLGGGMYWVDAAPEILDCNVIGNLAYEGGGMFGTNGSAIIENCVIQSNFAGVGPNDVDDIAGRGGGIFSASVAAEIVDCDIAGNEAGASGGGIFFTGDETSWLTVSNCLVLSNEAGRDGGGISANWHAGPIIENCTVVGNEATGSFGEPGSIGFGGGLYSSYNSDSEVIDSIFWGNYAEEGFQIAVGTGFEFSQSPSTVDVSYSDIQGGRAAVWVDVDCTLNWDAGSNINEDPLFADGPLGGYYLSQTATGDPNQTGDSPCVDSGSDLASNVGLHTYTTRTDGESDKGIVDMGYHYPLPIMLEPCRICDLVFDGIINFYDFAMFALNWFSEDCSTGNNWCQGADCTFDTYVDYNDLAYFAECWLVKDTTAPIPNPSKWKIEPRSASTTPPYSISMTAETAVDGWGFDIQYYFKCVTDAVNSGWQDEPNWVDTGLDVNTEYGYMVKARDGVEWIPDDGTGEPGNKTGWSVVGYAVVGADTTPPQPNPMAWSSEPNAISPNSIEMVATIATDASGVEYYFEETTGNPNGTDSGWQDEPNYTDTGLDADTTYTYRVRARDKSVNHNATAWSDPCSATTLPEGAEPDTTPPTPDPATWETEPYATSFTSILMVATTALDPSGVEYYFECTSNPLYSSNPDPDVYQDSPIYEVTGLPEGMYTFVVRVRDAYLNTTGDSVAVTVDLEPPTPNPMEWLAGSEPDLVFNAGDGFWYAEMEAVVATDAESEPVEYEFLCVEAQGIWPSGFSSGWIPDPNWSVAIGPPTPFTFRVRARDSALPPNVTVWSPDWLAD